MPKFLQKHLPVTMFKLSKATTINLSSFNTSSVTDMSLMFGNSQATELDLSSFNTSNVTNMSSMFIESQASVGYARVDTDKNRFNNSSNKPVSLIFIVKQ